MVDRSVVVGGSVPRSIGDGARVFCIGIGIGIGLFGDIVEGGELATGLEVPMGTALGLKSDGRAIGLELGDVVVELED